MQIRAFEDRDWPAWLRLSELLFPHETRDALETGMRTFRARDDAEVFVAERGDGSVCGFVEVGTRPYADGCDTSPVAYVEAWCVDADVRLQGVGRALLAAAESWARARGHTEIGSDTLLENVDSERAHKRSGYVEMERLIVFRKLLA